MGVEMDMEKIGTIDEFHSKTCYNLYMYAVKLAKQVNEYIDKGCLVLSGEQRIDKFIFHKDDPCIAEYDGYTSMIWYGSCYDDNGKVWLHGDVTKKQIKKDFKNIDIYEPANRIKLKL
jgi:hypothetical protein